MANSKSCLLLSGGLDSISVAYWIRPSSAVTIDYGQKPAMAEIKAAQQLCKQLHIDHHTISVDCSSLGSGDLSDNNQLDIAPVSEWWPYRNQMLLTFAAMKMVQMKVKELIVGSVSTDEIHVDGRPLFYSKISDIISLQEGNISVSTPAIHLTSVELIKQSSIPENLLLLAHSCHTSNEPCMKCRGCFKHLHTLQQLGIE